MCSRRLTLLAALLGCLPLTAQQAASIRGRAIDSTTGQPLSRVHVRLLVPSREEGVSAAYGAISDDAGWFSISTIPPGAYMVQGIRAGYFYVPTSKDGPPKVGVTLQAGQHLDDFQLTMAPRAILTGHVLTDDGSPVEDAHVHLEPASDTDAALALAPQGSDIGGATIDNPQGEFRFSVPPGKYHLRVHAGSAADEIHPDGTVTGRFFGETYYPSASDQKSAGVVEAKPGQETSGLDIRARLQGPLTISGSVTGVPKGGSATVAAECKNGGQTTVPDAADGTFLMKDIQAGRCRLYAFGGDFDRLISAPMTVDLKVPISGVVLSLQESLKLTGALKPPVGAAIQMVRLEPMEEYSVEGVDHGRVAPVTRDGAFEFDRLEPVQYRLAVIPGPADFYIKSILTDQTELTARVINTRRDTDAADVSELQPVLDLRHAAEVTRLRILFGPGASLFGKLIDSSGPVAHEFSGVMLIPEGTPPDEGLRTKLASDGSYAFRGLPPGKYRLIGFDARSQQEVDDLKLEKLVAQSKPIELKEGDRLALDIGLSAKGDGDGRQ